MTKIAFASEDGLTISRHLGRAPYYVVLTIEEGQVVAREQREKPSHVHGHQPGRGEHGGHQMMSGPGEPAGGHEREHEPEEGAMHNRMAGAAADCEIVIAGGMGAPARAALERAGIKVILTELRDIDVAAQRYVAGRLVDQPERVHGREN